jgi:hypothetical protein
MGKILEALKKLSGWVIGGMGFLVTLITAIILFRDNFQLTVVVIIVIIDSAVMIAVGYIQSYKTPSLIIGGVSSYKYSKNLRRFSWIGLAVLIAANIWFFLSTLGGGIVTIAIYGLPTPTATIAPTTTNVKPAFEINFIGLPYKDDTSYYVTNNMIGNKDLDKFKDFFTLSPLKIEVVPHYLQDDKFGNLVLRVFGKNDAYTDFPLWQDFDKTAETKTLEFTYADIVALSGIQSNTINANTNLTLDEAPYQIETLRFEVVKLSEPDLPYVAKELPVKNAPWRQSVAVEYRNGWMLDYAVTNLGAPTKFHCKANLFTTLSDVSSNPDSAWSGTKSLLFGYDCGEFDLETNKTYVTSIPLNKEIMGVEFMHGRYLVQVYTVPERSDITFQGSWNYDNVYDMWMFANRGNLETFVICDDPGKTCAETTTLPIEKIPFLAKSLINQGGTDLAVRTYEVGNRVTNQYIYDYWFETQGNGYVSLGFYFDDPVDISNSNDVALNGIRFKVKLDKSMHTVVFEVIYKSGDEYKPSRVDFGNGIYGVQTLDEQTVTIPFNAFAKEVDWTKIKSLHIVLDGYRVPDTDKHEIQISEIEFIH